MLKIIDEVVGRLNLTAPVDVIRSFARPIAAAASCVILGISEGDAPAVGEALAGLAPLMDPAASGLEREQGRVASLGLMRQIHRVMAERKFRSTSVIGDLLRLADAQRITRHEYWSLILLIAHASFENSENALSLGALSLFRDPGLARSILRDVDSARVIEELLRLNSPAQAVLRVATENLSEFGLTVPKGSLVFPMLAAANIDETVFGVGPQVVTRPRHLSFGAGPHACPGAGLAKREISVGLRALATRMANETYEIAELSWKSSRFMHGPKTLVVAMRD
jgi:hypothetical protein